VLRQVRRQTADVGHHFGLGKQHRIEEGKMLPDIDVPNTYVSVHQPPSDQSAETFLSRSYLDINSCFIGGLENENTMRI
jgi:hypothetical protein